MPFFWAGASLGLFIFCAVDFLLLIAFIVIAVVLGKPLSYLSCAAIDSASAAESAAGAYAFTMSLGHNVNFNNGSFFVWGGATRANCYESKAVWGMSIALWFVSLVPLGASSAKQN